MLRNTTKVRLSEKTTVASMIMKTLLIIVLFVLANTAHAQRVDEGFVVLNSGDTLRGAFKLPTAKYMIHHEVVFGPDATLNEKYKLLPEEITGFTIGNDVYQSRFIWSDKATKKFLKVVTIGYCTLYEYQYAPRNCRGMVGQPVLQYYGQKENGLLHALDFATLRKGKDAYFDDNIGLMTDIRQGQYKKNDIPEIVKRYNREHDQHKK